MGRVGVISTIKQQLKAARKSLGKKKPLSLSEFAQEVSSQLQYEIKTLSKRNKKHAKFLKALENKLSDFPEYLVASGESLHGEDDSNILIALDMLERLCKVSCFIFCTISIVSWLFNSSS